MRIGVDVGGTNTDAAIMQENRVIASVKSPTTADIATGIVVAVRNLLRRAKVKPCDVETLMIGTTQFTNAFVERRRLNEVGVIRICLPASDSLLPMAGWPLDLKHTIGNEIHLVHGGSEFDGRPIAPLDEREVLTAIKSIKRKGLRSVAISSVFSPVNNAMETRVKDMLLNNINDVEVTLSSDIGKIGLIERENAGIMNAALADLSKSVVGSFRDAFESLGIHAPFYISQNDGTLMSANYVEKYPVLTFSSGPTNSMRGAAFLSGLKDAIVVDIGGTTADVGVLVNGYPRETSMPVDIGGVRTNFRMPDILAVGLGGGSVVRLGTGGNLSIGPDSVGYKLLNESLVFGGDTLTATDIVVAAGFADIGDKSTVASIDQRQVTQALQYMNSALERAIDKMKTSTQPIPVILVGGGSILVTRSLQGVSECRTPERSAEANAIGAAMSQVGGVVDRLFSYSDHSREEIRQEATEAAFAKALAAGGDADSLDVVEIEEIPLAYSDGGTVRVRVKAVADLADAPSVKGKSIVTSGEIEA